ncbi:conserved hypothetical protein [Candidatus Magnetomoraceae bacterium gMMP-15]
MATNSNEVKNLLSYLKKEKKWDHFAIYKFAENVLRNTLEMPVRLCKHSDILLSYHIDLRKEIDPDFKECLIFFIHPNADSSSKRSNRLLEDMQNTILKEGLENQPHLIFLFGEYETQEIFIIENFRGSFISNPESFKTLLSVSLPGKEILARLRRMNQVDMAECPFHYLGPCSPEMFVGRSELIREILGGAQNSYAIAGGRRIGKTSLLIKLQTEAKTQKEYRPFLLDCSNFSSIQELINEIIRRLFPHYYQGQKRVDNFTFDEILERVKNLEEKKLFLLLDEIDPLIKKAKDKSKDAVKFFSSIRGESNKNKVKLVISGFRMVMEMIDDNEHPLYNLCERKRLCALEHRDMKELISIPFLKMGINLKPEQEVLTKIYDFTAGHPSIVQYIAKQLFQIRKGNIITLNDLNKVIKGDDLIDFIYDNFVMNTSPLERLICLLTLGKKNFNMDDILELFERKEIDFNDSMQIIHKALNNLKSNNILKRHKNRYQFFYPLMKDIIKEYFLSPYIIKTLIREVKKNGK